MKCCFVVTNYYLVVTGRSSARAGGHMMSAERETVTGLGGERGPGADEALVRGQGH